MFSRRKRTPRSQSQRPQTAPGKPQAPGRPPEFYARQATRTVRSRTFWLMLVMGILVFVILFFQLYHLQITRHKELQTKALDQQTRQTVVSAFRGTIYDRNGSQLAVSVSTEDVVMSPYHMKKQLDDEAERLEKIRLENAQLKKGETPQSEDTTVLWDYDSLAASLADILGISQDDVRERMNNTDSQYELLAKKVDEDTANQIRQLINDLKVEGLDLTATSKRVYPYGSLASHVLGFVGTDNTGLYGLESRYDKYLQGQTGLVVTAKDERGNPLPYEYEQYFAAQSGQDLVLTLDANVQYYLEKYVGEMADKYGAENGATGIVMDVKTGGVLGMVSYPTYDLNRPERPVQKESHRHLRSAAEAVAQQDPQRHLRARLYLQDPHHVRRHGGGAHQYEHHLYLHRRHPCVRRHHPLHRHPRHPDPEGGRGPFLQPRFHHLRSSAGQREVL